METPASGATRVAPAPEAAKKTTAPPARDFPRRPPPQDAVFADPPEEAGAPDVEHPWAEYLRLCAAAKASLDGKSLDLDHTDQDLPTVLADIEAKTGIHLNIDVPAETQGKKISFAVKGLIARHVLRLLLQQYDLRYVISGDGQIWIEPESGKTSVHEPPFAAELKALKDMSGGIIAARAPKPGIENDRQLTTALESIKVSYDFRETLLPEVVSFLQEASQLNIMIDRRQLDGDTLDTAITATGSGQRVDQALTSLFDGRDLAFRMEQGVLIVTSREDVENRRAAEAAEKKKQAEIREAEQDLFARTVAFGGENLRLREVAEILAKGLGVPYVIDPGTWSRKARYTIEERQRPASEIVTLLRKGAPLIVAYRDGILWFLSPEGVK